jgi:hypothetical protein
MRLANVGWAIFEDHVIDHKTANNSEICRCHGWMLLMLSAG